MTTPAPPVLEDLVVGQDHRRTALCTMASHLVQAYDQLVDAERLARELGLPGDVRLQLGALLGSARDAMDAARRMAWP